MVRRLTRQGGLDIPLAFVYKPSSIHVPEK